VTAIEETERFRYEPALADCGKWLIELWERALPERRAIAGPAAPGRMRAPPRMAIRGKQVARSAIGLLYTATPHAKHA
jgi:hypothetical protein